MTSPPLPPGCRLAVAPRSRPWIFLSVEIERQELGGMVGPDGPMVFGPSGDGVAIEPTLICQAAAGKRIRGWAICKYGAHEPRIALGGLSAEGIETVGTLFGIPVVGEGSWPRRNPELFYSAPAFAFLESWVQEHPRLAKRFGVSKVAGEPARWYAATSGSSAR